ncbi:hypothetical protein [Roseateles aquatilis]|nr:hypothetical protein [Roseateles aquatilis]
MSKPPVTAKHVPPMVIGLKALAVVAVAWGAVYPALLWGLGAVLP